jgi:poly(hydroxyalkanoate) depolymerase family esterase
MIGGLHEPLQRLGHGNVEWAGMSAITATRLTELIPLGANPGALGAATFIPTFLPISPPLVVVLHGSTQSAEDYDKGTGWSTLAEQLGIVLLFPEQRIANNATRGFNWFDRNDTQRDIGEPVSIRDLIEQVVRQHSIDRARIFITGMSAGGAMTSVMLAAYPDVFAGGAIIAGLPFDSAANLWEAVLLMKGYGCPSATHSHSLTRMIADADLKWPSISVWHGSSDAVVDVSNAALIVRQWRNLHHLAAMPTREHLVDGHLRKVWCDPTGLELIEEFIIEGMGHGAPLDTTGVHAIGVTGRYMLEVGISSTRRIAEFWRLTGDGDDRITISAATTTLVAKQGRPGGDRWADHQDACGG